KGSGIALPSSDGTQPAVDVAVGNHWLRVRVSKRGNSVAIRMERSRAARTKSATRAPAARTTTRDKAPVSVGRTATRSRRSTRSQTAAPRNKAPSIAPRTKRPTAAPQGAAATVRGLDLDLELGAPTLPPRSHKIAIPDIPKPRALPMEQRETA